MSASDGGTLVILGNGFDLDLGLPTSYGSFFKSCQFPFVKGDSRVHNLGKYILRRGVVEKWYDLEDLLSSFSDCIKSIEKNKFDYDRLVEGLMNYLDSIDLSRLKMNSVAAHLMKALEDDLVLPEVYTFNYTSFDRISETLGLRYHNAIHVHGSLERKDIILGAGDYSELTSATDFLYKTSNANYRSSGLLESLENANEIYIFGLSLSKVDYPYFEDFFSGIIQRTYGGKKYVRIFTYDERSRMAVLRNIRGMNKGLIKLTGYSDFDIVCTCGNDEKRVQSVINHLSESKWEVA